MIKIDRKPLLRLIDIGVPRNISSDAKSVSGIESHDVDDLQEVVSRNQEARQKLALEAEGLIEEECRVFLEWWDSLAAVPTINCLRSGLESIRKEELQKALSKGIINKILHTPVTKLRAPQSRNDRRDSLDVIEKLFNLDVSSSLNKPKNN